MVNKDFKEENIISLFLENKEVYIRFDYIGGIKVDFEKCLEIYSQLNILDTDNTGEITVDWYYKDRDEETLLYNSLSITSRKDKIMIDVDDKLLVYSKDLIIRVFKHAISLLALS